MSDISAKASNVLQTNGCLKVSSKSSPASVAGAIAGMMKDGVPVEIQSVGAGAVNQAVKAIAISRGFLSSPVAHRNRMCSFFCGHCYRWRISYGYPLFGRATCLSRLTISHRTSPLKSSRGLYDKSTFQR